MDDLIYTLLILGWVGYGIYSAVNKNKAKETQRSTPRPKAPQSQSSIESLFETFFQESSPNPLSASHPYSAPETDEEILDSIPSGPDNYLDNYEEYDEADNLDIIPEPVLESKIDTYAGTDNVQASTITSEENDKIKGSAIDNLHPDSIKTKSFVFDLRQAVISQVLLERPYK